MLVVSIAALELARTVRMQDGLHYLRKEHEELHRRSQKAKLDETEEFLLSCFAGISFAISLWGNFQLMQLEIHNTKFGGNKVEVS